jgi:small redox-active disulfide protein 2
MKKVEVFGHGCSKCEFIAKRIMDVLEELNIQGKVEKITEDSKIIERGIILTPAVVVDGVLKCEGRIPTRDEIKNWLR